MFNGNENYHGGLKLNTLRVNTAKKFLREAGCRKIIDLGCGEGKLLKALIEENFFTELVGLDISADALESASRLLDIDNLTDQQKAKLSLIQGSFLSPDPRIKGFDAAVVLEVIEHLNIRSLEEFENLLFGYARPRNIILSTPNIEYNVLWPALPDGQFRDENHYFEWSRKQFVDWATRVSQTFSYNVGFLPIGPKDPERGAPTQMAFYCTDRDPKDMKSLYDDP